MYLKYLSLITICRLITCVLSDRQGLHHMLYQYFPNAISCFRLLNGTHQFGCYSDPGGSLGVIHVINSPNDVDWLFSSDAVAGPYMAVVSPQIFSIDVVMTKLRTSDTVSGILVAVNGTSDRPDSISPDDSCPNRPSNLPGTCKSNWNPHGRSYLMEDWGKPIFFVNDVEVISQIYECYRKFNVPLDSNQKVRNLCSLQMKGHMYAAVNTPTCYRRNRSFNYINPMIYCDPMGDRNIISSLFPLKNVKDKSLIVVTTRLDTPTMFDNLAPGAMSTATGIVILLATAKLLSEMIPFNSNYDKNVLFIMFSGESYDYIGSSRAVYDIINEQFPSKSRPINFNQIKLMFEVNQLDSSRNIFLHYNDSRIKDDDPEKEFRNILDGYAKEKKIRISYVPVGESVPPVSVQSFLKNDSNLPYLVLTNYNNQFTNKFYSSVFDNATNIDYSYANGTSSLSPDSVQVVLADLATALAKTLFKSVTGQNYTSDKYVKPELVDNLLHCYVETRQCQLFKENYPYEKTLLEPSSLYVGVARSSNIIVTLTQSTLASFTGNNTKMTLEACNDARLSDDEYEYIWITGKSGQGECIKSNSKFTLAVSPAFDIPDYDWASGQYSTWTESVWQDLSLRMYLKPSRQQELITLILGLVILFLSFSIVYWMKSKVPILFHAKPGVVC